MPDLEAQCTNDEQPQVTEVEDKKTAEEQLHAALYAAEGWPEVVRLLHDDLGLTKAQIGRAAEASSVTVGRWLEASGDAEVRSPQGLDDLRFVVLTLLADGRMRKSLLKFWLTSRDFVLQTDALSAIAQGRFEEVIAAGRAVPDMRRPSGEPVSRPPSRGEGLPASSN